MPSRVMIDGLLVDAVDPTFVHVDLPGMGHWRINAADARSLLVALALVLGRKLD